MMHRLTLLTIGFALPASAFRLHGKGDSVATTDAEEVAEQRFWSSQWHALENDLLRLRQALEPNEAHRDISLLANSSSTKHTQTNQATPSNSTLAKTPSANSTAAKTAVVKAVVQKVSKEHHEAMSAQDRLAKVDEVTKGLKGKMMLQPMLAMLKGLYEDQKDRIGELNKKEEESKKKYVERKAEFQKRLDRVKKEFDDHQISEGFYKNQTRDYTHQFKYWEGVRERAHRQFHTNLKLTHGLMAKEKDTIKQYEAAIAKSFPTAPAAVTTLAAAKTKDAAKPAKEELPDVDLIQQKSSLARFCEEALVQVRTALGQSSA